MKAPWLALAFVCASFPAMAFDPCFAVRVTSQLARGESLRAQAAALSPDDPLQQAAQVMAPTGSMIAAAAIAQADAQASLQSCLDAAAHGR